MASVSALKGPERRKEKEKGMSWFKL